jgi:hypothetical protein
MYLTSCLYSPFKLLDISEWTICTYKKSAAFLKIDEVY